MVENEILVDLEYEDQERLAIQEESKDPERPSWLSSSDQILTREFPEPIWAIPELLPVGLVFIAGRPKIGKSWLSMQIAKAVSSGEIIFGKNPEPGRVLILHLEDHQRRLQSRMKLQSWPPRLPVDLVSPDIFRSEIGFLDKGGGKRLAGLIENFKYRLVIVDTFARSTQCDGNDMLGVTRGLSPIQEKANELNACVIFIDHHRKGLSETDNLNDLLGSTAKSAVSDTIWSLYRERGKAGAKLTITGRDVEETTLALEMDWTQGLWTCEGEAGLYELTGRQSELINFLEDAGPSGIMDISGALDMAKGNTYRIISDLANKGLILKTGRGRGNVRYELRKDTYDSTLL